MRGAFSCWTRDWVVSEFFRGDDDDGGAWRGGGVLFLVLRLHIMWAIRQPSQLLMSLESHLPSNL